MFEVKNQDSIVNELLEIMGGKESFDLHPKFGLDSWAKKSTDKNAII